ncbi:hypothetical protein Ssi03_13900 [Sphaerisporangium siamense]|nr:hypothetical protein Ssi03_13900 [Sphaerisporangium siamense]
MVVDPAGFVLSGVSRPTSAGNVVELVVRAVAEHPAAVAVRDGDHVLTYAQLAGRAAGFGRMLREELGMGGMRVGLALQRGIPQQIAVLSVLAAGACYVPLDPALPAGRLEMMIEDAGLGLIVVDEAYAGPVGGCRTVVVPAVDAAGPELLGAWPADPGDTAYVLFTSGSTGRPKGVAMPHHPLVNLIEWQLRDSPAGPGDRTLQFAPIGFDVSFQEIFSTWGSGGELVLIGEEDRRDPGRVLELAHRYGVSRLFLPFAALQSIAEWAVAMPGPLPVLREIITAGEQPIITPALERFVEATGDPTLANQYGPTETHVVTRSLLRGRPQDWPRVPPLGSVVDNCSVYLLDDAMNPVPAGAEGEICLAGSALADGYVVDDERTRGRFIEVRGIGRVYRTGDFGVLEAGTLLYRGRRDDQVKVSGHRVEIGEVEAALSANRSVGQVAVVPVGHGATDRHLAAFVVPRAGSVLVVEEVRAAAARVLPPYAVPRRFEVLDSLPRTRSDKVDRRALAESLAPEGVQDAAVPADLRDAVRRVWQRVLGVVSVPDDAQYFDLGGDSLTAVRLVVELNRSLARRVSVGDLLMHPRFADFVEFVQGGAGRTRFQPQEIAPAASDGTWFGVAATQSHRMNREAWRARHDLPSISNVPMAYHLTGPLDTEALSQALQWAVIAHPALRLEVDPDGRRQRLTAWSPTLRVVAVTAGFDAQTAREQALSIIQRDAETPFARCGPAYDGLLRATLVRVSEREHYLFLNADHIVFDGWSIGALNDDLSRCYASLTRGETLPAPVPDDRFLRWARTEQAWLDEELAHALEEDWRRSPWAVADPAAVLLFPEPAPGPAEDFAAEELIRRRLGPEPTRTLQAVSRAMAQPMGSVVTALYAEAFARWSGRKEVALVSTFANRTVPDAERSVGFFANNIPVFLGNVHGLPLQELIRRSAQEVGRAAQREAVPLPFWFGTLLPGHRDLAGYARFLFLNVRGQDREGSGDLRLPGVTSTPVKIDIRLTPSFALGLRVGDNGDSISLELAFLPALVPRERAELLMREIEGAITRAACLLTTGAAR